MVAKGIMVIIPKELVGSPLAKKVIAALDAVAPGQIVFGPKVEPFSD